MKIWWRWIKITFTCGLHRHAPRTQTALPGNVTYTECPRCHQASYDRPGLPRTVWLNPSYWDVARGLYDRGIQE